MQETTYQLDTRDRPRLLVAMMRALASDESKISFEGELSRTELARIVGVVHEETGVLRKNTLWPKLDFLVLPLTPRSLATIEKAITPKSPLEITASSTYRFSVMGELRLQRTTVLIESVLSPFPPFLLHCFKN